MTDLANLEVHALLGHLVKECHKRGYCMVGFAMRYEGQKKDPVFVSNVLADDSTLAEIFREAAGLLERGVRHGTVTHRHGEGN